MKIADKYVRFYSDRMKLGVTVQTAEHHRQCIRITSVSHWVCQWIVSPWKPSFFRRPCQSQRIVWLKTLLCWVFRRPCQSIPSCRGQCHCTHGRRGLSSLRKGSWGGGSVQERSMLVKSQTSWYSWKQICLWLTCNRCNQTNLVVVNRRACDLHVIDVASVANSDGLLHSISWQRNLEW